MSDSILKENPNISYTENEPNINVEEFIKVVQTRRSVRQFENGFIPENIMNSCLDLALLAPNSSNLQPWTFYWVRSEDKKKKLVEACLSQNAARTAAELVVCVARTGTWNLNRNRILEHFENTKGVPKQAIDYYDKVVPFIYSQGPLGIFGFIKKIMFALHGLRKPTLREPTSQSEMITWATKSCALACENLMLALRAYSYDSCPMEGYDSRMIRKILDLPKDASITMVIGAGKRSTFGIYGPRLRFDRKNYIKEV